MGERQQRQQDVVLPVPDLRRVPFEVLQELAARLDHTLGGAGRAGGPHDQAVGELAPGVDGQPLTRDLPAGGGHQQLVEVHGFLVAVER
ncbi:hypothetical protein Sgleb_67500 [Streptomyces glebosus]|uniref:Uncharacterized protein n=1 Tax=Streptomyces glebosus TaxID=249580 RepID=A0A640T4R9_9ACTN|nr:hypothetical protein Sgleb_67500 [Streptomyces glebosus]GHG50021.1 hypothetical protein GCM10010513_08500 [Streptomyces glebosus]